MDGVEKAGRSFGACQRPLGLRQAAQNWLLRCGCAVMLMARIVQVLRRGQFVYTAGRRHADVGVPAERPRPVAVGA